jgi:hypothetical protein
MALQEWDRKHGGWVDYVPLKGIERWGEISSLYDMAESLVGIEPTSVLARAQPYKMPMWVFISSLGEEAHRAHLSGANCLPYALLGAARGGALDLPNPTPFDPKAVGRARALRLLLHPKLAASGLIGRIRLRWFEA